MKRGRKMILLLLVLAALGLGTWAVMGGGEQPVSDDIQESGAVILRMEGITELSWSYNGTDFSFQKDGEIWTDVTDPAYTVDASYMTAILDSLKELKAEKEIGEPMAEENYGLDVPVCTVQAGEQTLRFGEANPISGYRYLSLGDGKVYLVQEKHMTVYTYDRLTMVQKEEIPDLSQIIGIRAETESETVELEYLEENDLTYTDQYTWFLKNNGGYAPADQSVVEGLLLYLEDMSWLACADYAMTEPEVYGLDVPAARYTLTYLDGEEEKTFCLNVGDGDDEGIWVNIPGSSMVYTVNSTLGQMLGQMDADSYVCKDVILLDLEPVTAVELTVDAMSCTLEKTETEQEDGTVLTQWMLEDASVEIEATLLSMSELQGSSWEGTVEGLEPELTVTFRRNTENYPVLTVSFYRYSGSECIAVCNDGAPLSVYRTDVVTLKEAILAAVLPG